MLQTANDVAVIVQPLLKRKPQFGTVFDTDLEVFRSPEFITRVINEMVTASLKTNNTIKASYDRSSA